MKIRTTKAIKDKNMLKLPVSRDWRIAYVQKTEIGWSRIDRNKFIREFMNCQYENVIEKFDENGESNNDIAMRNYFHRIRRNEKPATEEATNFANVFFQINR